VVFHPNKKIAIESLVDMSIYVVEGYYNNESDLEK
jgi:hypothetical protein